MEQLWVKFARENPLGAKESLTEYLERFVIWCGNRDSGFDRVLQLEKAVKAACDLMERRRLMSKDGTPSEFAHPDERDLIRIVGQAQGR